MERVVKTFSNFKEAEEDEILQEINLTPEERFIAAKKLRDQVYGTNIPDVRNLRRS